MSDLPPPTSRRLTGVHFKSYVWPQILSYESVSLCKLCLLFFGPMNASVICQFEKLCTFHLFAEIGVQSGRDRGYVRARRQPSSFLGDENETYTKIIEEMASFQLYNFVSHLPPSPTYAVDFPSSSYDSRLMQLHSQGAKYRLVLPHNLHKLCPSFIHFTFCHFACSCQVKIVYKYCWCSSRICDVFTDTTSRCQFLDFVLTKMTSNLTSLRVTASLLRNLHP